MRQFGAFAGVVLHLLPVELCLETDEVLLVLPDILDELRGIVRAGKGVRVLTIGQQNDLDEEALAEEHVYTSYSCVDTCCIAIVEDGDVCGEAFDESDLRLRKGCASGSDNILNARLVH